MRRDRSQKTCVHACACGLECNIDKKKMKLRHLFRVEVDVADTSTVQLTDTHALRGQLDAANRPARQLRVRYAHAHAGWKFYFLPLHSP